MSFGDFLKIVEVGGEPVVGMGLALCAFLLWRLYGVLNAIKEQITEDRVETAKFREQMMGRLGVVERAVENHGNRISILEHK